MKPTLTLLTALLLAPLSGTHAADVPKAAARPNVLLIISDDQGVSDFGCAGNHGGRALVVLERFLLVPWNPGRMERHRLHRTAAAGKTEMRGRS